MNVLVTPTAVDGEVFGCFLPLEVAAGKFSPMPKAPYIPGNAGWCEDERCYSNSSGGVEEEAGWRVT